MKKLRQLQQKLQIFDERLLKLLGLNKCAKLVHLGKYCNKTIYLRYSAPAQPKTSLPDY